MMLKFETSQAIRYIYLVGCGGTGGHLAKNLARMLWHMQQSDMHLPEVTFVDPDVIELGNVGRQNFILQDQGEVKSLVLARRFNLVFGLSIRAIPEAFDPARHINASGRANNVLLIDCVDNYQARRQMASVEHAVWLSCGNDRLHGQVVLGTNHEPEAIREHFEYQSRRQNERDRQTVGMLPNAGIVLPELLDPPPPDEIDPDTELSCEELVSLGDQHLLVNDMMAGITGQYVYCMLHRIPLAQFITYVDLGSLTMKSIPVDKALTYI